MGRFGEVKVTMKGDKAAADAVLRIFDKVKARYTRIGSCKDEDGNDLYDIECFVSNRKIWKIHKKLKELGDVVID